MLYFLAKGLLGLTETDLRALERSAEGGDGEVKAHLSHHNLVLVGVLQVVLTEPNSSELRQTLVTDEVLSTLTPHGTTIYHRLARAAVALDSTLGDFKLARDATINYTHHETDLFQTKT